MKNSEGFTVWLTGLPGSGKSTLAKLLDAHLRQWDRPVALLDGDEVRKTLSKGLGFTRKDREEHIRRLAYVAKLLSRMGGVAIVAAISPYAQSRDEARKEIENFVEVFVKCPLQICMERDPKGLYAKSQRGEISNFTGISDPYEEPRNPEILVETDMEPPEESCMKILKQLEKLQLLKSFTMT